MDIDVVITWVNGNDPILNAKRAKYLNNNSAATRIDQIAAATRYADRGEIHWCVQSINRFMPWAHRIFIVTDQQNPKVESKIPVEIVDHTIIFRDFEQFLPTFNSISLETMLWRIPNLSEHFVYFNDDLLLCRDITPHIFFPSKDCINCHGQLASILWTNTRYFLKQLFGNNNSVNHVRQMMLAANIIGSTDGHFVRLSHTPHPFFRSTLEQIYTARPELLNKNARNRFRCAENFRNDELVYMQLRKDGRLIITDDRPFLLEYTPKGGNIMRLKRKLDKVTKPDSKVCFINFASLDKATDKEFRYIESFVNNLW